MAFDTKINLSCTKVEQCTGDTLFLSGSTTFASGSSLSILPNLGDGKVLGSDSGGIATWHTIVGSGGTTVTHVGDEIRICSTDPTGTTVSWGNVTGDINNQTDLQNCFDTFITGASNGLSVVGQQVILGGTLTGDTLIELAGNTLAFTGTTGGSSVCIANSLMCDGKINVGECGSGCFDHVFNIEAGHINSYTLSVPNQMTVSLAGAGAGNLSNGLYYYGVEYLTPYGGTGDMTYSGAGFESVTVTDNSTDGQVCIQNIPVGQPHQRVCARRLWRSCVGAAGGYQVRCLATINDNTTTTYLDNTADAGLGADQVYRLPNKTAGFIYLDGICPVMQAPGIFLTTLGYGAAESLTTAHSMVAIGGWAGRQITSGVGNTLMGYSAGVGITTGGNNVGLGYGSVYYINTHSDNIGIGGNYAMRACGNCNIAIGSSTMATDTSVQSYNVVIGRCSFRNFCGSFNTSVGGDAGLGASSTGTSCGCYNVFMGYRTAYNLGNANVKNRNTIIGGLAGFNLDGSLNTALGFCSAYNASGCCNIFIGTRTGFDLTTGCDNIYIGENVQPSSPTVNCELRIGNQTTYLIEGCFNGGSEFLASPYEFKTNEISEYGTGSGITLNNNTLIDGTLRVSGVTSGTGSDNILIWNPTDCQIYDSGVNISGVTGATGFEWTGSSANGIGTYVDGDYICSNPNLTFNGNALTVCGGVNQCHTGNTEYRIYSNVNGIATAESSIIFIDDSTFKYSLRKDSNNNFYIYDYANTSIPFRIETSTGHLSLNPSGDVRVCSDLAVGIIKESVANAGVTIETVCLKDNRLTGSTLCATTCVESPVICGTSCVRGEILCSVVTTGTAPIQVQSTTLNTNLNADLLDGYHASGLTGLSGSTNGLSDDGTIVCLGGALIEQTCLSGGFALNLTGNTKLNTQCGLQISGITMFDSTRNDISNIAIGQDALCSDTGSTYNTAIGVGALCNNTDSTDNVAIGRIALRDNVTCNGNVAIGSFALQVSTGNTGSVAIGCRAMQLSSCGINQVAIGPYAGCRMCGNYNIAIGYNSQVCTTGRFENIGIGRNTLALNDGNSNIGIGTNALCGNDTGHCNVALGYQAMTHNRTGCNNSAFGAQALFCNLTGSHNAAFGSYAGNNLTGHCNVVIGRSAGLCLCGNCNVAIGYCAAANVTGNSQLHIANHCICTLIYGDFAAKCVCIDNHLYTCRFTITSGASSGYILVSDSTGNATWQPSSGVTGTTVAWGDISGNLEDQTDLWEILTGTTGVSSYWTCNGTYVYPTDESLIISGNTVDTFYGYQVSGITFVDATRNSITNVAVGQNTLNSNTTGIQNVAVGNSVLCSNTGGNSNVGIGFNVLPSNVDGGTNIAMGFWSMWSNTGGSSNVAIGSYSLRYSLDTSFNVGIGTNTLEDLVLGNDNVAIGNRAFASITGGCRNVGMGYYTAANATGGNFNIAMGAGAFCLNQTGGYNVAIGNAALRDNETGSNSVAIGNAALALNVVGTDNIAIGNNALYNATGISCNVAIGDNAGSNLNGDYNTVLGYFAGRYVNGNSNVAIGNQAMLYGCCGGHYNVAIGYLSMYCNQTGLDNIALGQCALRVNKSGCTNVAIGYRTLTCLGDGDNNVAIGDGALCCITGGSSNIGIGDNAMGCTTTGTYNIGIGFYALARSNANQATQNIGIGSYALTTNTTGYCNIGIGNSALYCNDAGYHNVAVGAGALRSNTSGCLNVAIGNQALYGCIGATGCRNVAIGYGAMYCIDSGLCNVAIGTCTGYFMTSGQGNTAVGEFAMYRGCVGHGNTAIGCQALYCMSGGSCNVGVGHRALWCNYSGSDNVAIGKYAGYNETGSSRLHIANSNVCTLIYGEFDNKIVCVDNHLYTCCFTMTCGAVDGFILTSDASGNATWQAASGVTGTTVPWGAITGDISDQTDLWEILTGATGASGTITGATNGLTAVGQDIILGGTLTGDTTINMATGNCLTIGGGLAVTGYTCTDFLDEYTGSHGIRVPSGTYVTIGQTGAPNAPLDVRGSSSTAIYGSTNSSNYGLDFYNASSTGSAALLRQNSSTGAHDINVLQLQVTTTTTATTGMSAGLLYRLEDAGGTTRDAGKIRVGITDPSAGVMDTNMYFCVLNNGTLTEVARLTTTGISGDTIYGKSMVCSGLAVCSDGCVFASTHVCTTCVDANSCVVSPLISGTTFATTSTSLVSNLNADLLDGLHASDLTGCTAVAYGSNDQIPYTNAGGNGFDYGDFCFDGTNLCLYASGHNIYTNQIRESGSGVGVFIDSLKIKDFRIERSDATPNYVEILSGQITLATNSGSTIWDGTTFCVSGNSAVLKSAIHCSTISTGTAPVQVQSTTLNTNLNADLLDGYHASGLTGTSLSFGTDNQIPYVNTGGDDFDYGNLTFNGTLLDVTGNVCGNNFTGTTYCATNGFTGGTVCGISCVRSTSIVEAPTVRGTSITCGGCFCSTVTTGTAPVQVNSTTLNTNLNADLLDGLHASELTGATSGATYWTCDGTYICPTNSSLIISGNTVDAFYGYKISGTTIFDVTRNSLTNIAIGQDALINDTSGTNNVAIGWCALWGNVIGAQNIAIGGEALACNTGGTNNVALGYDALFYNCSGTDNIAIGLQALFNNLTGLNNIGLGCNVLNSNQSGCDNIGIGRTALEANTSGCRNVAIGTLTLCDIINGVDNVAIGTGAMCLVTGGSYSVAIGDGAMSLAWCSCTNIGIGHSAHRCNTTGRDNVAIGNQAFYSNQTGIFNTALNFYALAANTTGCYNFAAGDAVLSDNTTGCYNIGIGASTTLSRNISGHYNIALGSGAQYYNTGGTYNVALGADAMYGNVVGCRNVAIGNLALRNVSGNTNVGIGYQAGFNATGSSELYIAHSQNCTLIYGDFAAKCVCIDNHLYTNCFSMISGASNGYVLTSDASGNATWSPSSAVTSGSTISFGTDNQVPYTNAAGDDFDYSACFTFDGTSLNLGSNNYISLTTFDIRLGSSRGIKIDTFENASLGYLAGGTTMTGQRNVLLGNSAGNAISNGDDNVLIGICAGLTLSNGGNNVAIGTYALQTVVSTIDSVAVGYGAMRFNCGNFNTVVGYQSGYGTPGTDGVGNTFVGYCTGTNLSTGDYNVILGYCVSLANGACNATLRIGCGSTISLAGNLATGQITMPQYGSGTFSGTTAKWLGVDSSGNITEEDPPTAAEWGCITGSISGQTDLYSNLETLSGYTDNLTDNYVPYWTTSSGFTDSNIFITGTTGGTYIGINRTDPEYDVDICGSLRVTSGGVFGQSEIYDGLVVNSSSGSSAIDDFQVNTSNYCSIYSSASGDSLMLMSNILGCVGFFGCTPTAQSTGWAATDCTTCKSYSASATTLNELSNVVATLINELIAKGLIGS